MPSAGFVVVAMMLVAVQATDSRACSQRPSQAPPPATLTPATPSVEVFTTADGVRFTANTVATNLEIPWSMAFAPDGRLFVTERPGRVRIVDIATRASELALTLDDVYTVGEAGL